MRSVLVLVCHCQNDVRATCARSDRTWLHPFSEPALDFLVEHAPILRIENPVILVGPDEEPARHTHSLQERPHLDRVVERHSIIPLTDRQQHRRLELGSEPRRILRAPDFVLLPDRAKRLDLTVIDAVGGSPLRLEVHETGVTYQRLEPRTRPSFESVREMSTVTRSARHLA